MSTATISEEETQQQDESYTVEDVPGGVFKALHKHSASESGRYDLNCLHVEEQELVAANGAVLARIRLPEELGPEELYRFSKPSLRKRKPARLIRRNGQLTVEQEDGSSIRVERFTPPEGGGHWPEHYKEVIPPESEGTAVSASVSNLKKVIDLLDCAGYENATIRVPDDPRNPFRIDGLSTDCAGRPNDLPIGVTVVVSPVVPDQDDM